LPYTVADLFISYNQAELDWAKWIAWTLESAGYSVIIQAWDFKAGANFVGEMDRSIKNADRMIAILSEQYLNSDYCEAEWQAFFRKDPKGERCSIIPVKVRPCEVKGLLARIAYIDFVGLPEAEANGRLLEQVRGGRAKPSAPPIFPGKARPAFPGLGAFPPPKPLTLNLDYPFGKSVAEPPWQAIPPASEVQPPTVSAPPRDSLAAILPGLWAVDVDSTAYSGYRTEKNYYFTIKASGEFKAELASSTAQTGHRTSHSENFEGDWVLSTQKSVQFAYYPEGVGGKQSVTFWFDLIKPKELRGTTDIHVLGIKHAKWRRL
jgi:hypothetical protein